MSLAAGHSNRNHVAPRKSGPPYAGMKFAVMAFAAEAVTGWSGCANVSSRVGPAPDAGGADARDVDGRTADSRGDGMAGTTFDHFPVMTDVFPGQPMPMTCATQSAMAERLPLDLYVMMDSSGSMVDTTTLGPTKWQAVQTAMTAFFNDPASDDVGVGLQYFPLVQPNVVEGCAADRDCGTFGPCDKVSVCSGPRTTRALICATNSDCQAGEACVPLGLCDLSLDYCAPPAYRCLLGDACVPILGNCRGRDRCDIGSYATPAVAIAPLRTSRAALTASLNLKQPDGLTPTGPALSGAIQTAKAQAADNPGHKVAVVLVTDGFPTECTPLDVREVAAIARVAETTAPAVPTFVIGVFAPDDAAAATMNLNLLAQAGGTSTAVVIDTNQNVTQALQMALNQIRTMAVACEYKIPAASGGAIDFNKVNVQLTESGGAITTIGHVSGQTSCDPAHGGWYYDVNPQTGATPASIVACQASCDQFRATTTARVDIVLGCQTFVII